MSPEFDFGLHAEDITPKKYRKVREYTAILLWTGVTASNFYVGIQTR
jgi:hypothetical protein